MAIEKRKMYIKKEGIRNWHCSEQIIESSGERSGKTDTFRNKEWIRKEYFPKTLYSLVFVDEVWI